MYRLLYVTLYVVLYMYLAAVTINYVTFKRNVTLTIPFYIPLYII